jgi:phage gp36-like protein
MFLQKSDLGQVIYGYQLNEITENDDNIVLQAMAAAEEETRSYIENNINKSDSLDGRLIYDTNAIFTAPRNNRHPLILQHCVTIAKWHVIQLCNMDLIYEQAKERYDRAISWLKMLSRGDIMLSSLPKKSIDSDKSILPFSSGSRLKYNHE